ncbi:MAG: tetratricopeptide repeat protein, partial [Candidatus Omnitrophica bacterium]|nr:tetratricopeptide repeat protein [Candidatus Omnitrophota bacterium]
GLAYLKLEKYEQAVESFERAAEVAPSSALIRSNLGLAYFHLGNRQRSMHHYERAIQLDPDNQLLRRNYLIAFPGEAEQE